MKHLLKGNESDKQRFGIPLRFTSNANRFRLASISTHPVQNPAPHARLSADSGKRDAPALAHRPAMRRPHPSPSRRHGSCCRSEGHRTCLHNQKPRTCFNSIRHWSSWRFYHIGLNSQRIGQISQEGIVFLRHIETNGSRETDKFRNMQVNWLPMESNLQL